jgi:hypothetical protein
MAIHNKSIGRALQVAGLLSWISLAACGGRTQQAMRDGGGGPPDSPSRDVRQGDGNPFDARTHADGDSSALPPDGSVCSMLGNCCSFLPQVDQHNCIYETRTMIDEMGCQSQLELYMEDGELDGGPCVGEGHGTPACASLKQCCGFLQAQSQCYEIADAGNQDACVTAFQSDQCVGP